jgi:mono/diheme cytochrome c family protein
VSPLRTLCLSLLLSPLTATAQLAPPPVDVGQYLQGRAIFAQQCSPCHGNTGRGDGSWGEKVTDKPRNLRLGHFKFRSTPGGFLPTTQDLERTIRSGISGTMMPAFTQLSDHDLRSVITYIRSFSSRWKNPANYHPEITLPPIPAWYSDPTQRKQQAAQAAPLFTVTCAICHGPDGKGNGLAAPNLVDIMQNPIQPADFTKPNRKSGSSPADLYRSIATGLDGTPMPGYHQILQPETIWQLVAHIQSLSEKPSPAQ